MLKSLLLATTLLTLASCGGVEKESGSTDSYPSKNINIIVAYKAGGGTDIGARVLTKEASSKFEKPLTIINRPGADGQLGFTELSNAKPDGYTIGFINLPNYVSLSLTRDTKFNKDTIIPIINYVYDPGLLLVKGDSEIDSIEEFIEYAKENPNEIRVSNNGTGASNNIGALEFAGMAGIELNHIPFGGSSDMIAALRGGHVEATLAKISEVASLIDSGELKALATFTTENIEGYEEIPTLTEKGYEVIFGSSRGLAAPAGTPDEIITYLHDVFKEVMESEEHMKLANDANMPIKYMSTEEYRTFIDNQEKSLKVILKDLGMIN